MRLISFGLDAIFTILSGALVYAWALHSGLPWALSVVSGCTVSYFASSYLFALLPSMARAAGGSMTTAAALLKTLRADGEQQDLPSGQRKAGKTSGKIQMGFGSAATMQPKSEPGCDCSQCEGRGHEPQDESSRCPVCRGTGRKPTLGRV